MKRAFLQALIALLLSHHQVRANTIAGTETLIGIVGKDFVLLGADSSVSSGIALTASHLDKIAVLADPFPGKEREKSPESQQIICAAAAGNSADCDRLIGLLRARLAIAEFEKGVGCDVTVVDCRQQTHKKSSSDTLVGFRSSSGMHVEALAQLARTLVVDNLRRAPFQVCLLIAGMGIQNCVHHPSSGSSSSIHMSEKLQSQVSTASVPFLSSPVKPDAVGRRPPLEASDERLVPHLYWLDEYGAAQKIEYGAHGYGSAFILSILDQGYHRNMSREEATKLMQNCFQQLRTRYTINSPNPPCIKCIDAAGCSII